MDDLTHDAFFSALPVFTRFEGVTDDGNYRPLPDDWYLALADIVSSTEAIAAGRYKAVNMAGASVISAVLNALGRADYPFVFGGDGACIVIPSSGLDRTRQALASVQSFVAADLHLSLRCALVPMADIRAQGMDVRVARFSPTDFVSYAMFAGGGTTWAEAQMKAGNYGVEADQTQMRPDLTGLSCRWNPIEARNGEIVSVIAVPDVRGHGLEFQSLVAGIIAIAAEQGRDGHPVPVDGPELGLALGGVADEARATASDRRILRRKLAIAAQIGLTIALHKLRLTLGSFDARRYKRDVAANSDFRKFDDGLKMTIDLDADRLARLEKILKEAEAKGICRYGLHRQASALMTCFVPTPLSRDHMHFIDGANGGYAMAAADLRASRSLAPRCPPEAGRLLHRARSDTVRQEE
ncbi:DUF3095 domain-containing protein [Rhizobium sp. L51/94]|uniref:DUF3095 domain-containing protein n=1 Tax=Rhizobium sp. L51/94 TaxID=2819999 RepID=UPI001C5B1132|nr:DUF3095 domain-containing protein [Rhizobium sp. L51/94]QXZ79450.1 DUF3095 domain-containing protein [Rhizobium sp. L51/94]